MTEIDRKGKPRKKWEMISSVGGNYTSYQQSCLPYILFSYSEKTLTCTSISLSLWSKWIPNNRSILVAHITMSRSSTKEWNEKTKVRSASICGSIESAPRESKKHFCIDWNYVAQLSTLTEENLQTLQHFFFFFSISIHYVSLSSFSFRCIYHFYSRSEKLNCALSSFSMQRPALNTIFT